MIENTAGMFPVGRASLPSGERTAQASMLDIEFGEHSDIGDHIVMRHATTSEWQDKIRAALTHSLEMWWGFFDDIERRL